MPQGITEQKRCTDCELLFSVTSTFGNPYRRCPACRIRANKENIEMSKKIRWIWIKK
jgi:hypothetical protein